MSRIWNMTHDLSHTCHTCHTCSQLPPLETSSALSGPSSVCTAPSVVRGAAIQRREAGHVMEIGEFHERWHVTVQYLCKNQSWNSRQVLPSRKDTRILKAFEGCIVVISGSVNGKEVVSQWWINGWMVSSKLRIMKTGKYLHRVSVYSSPRHPKCSIIIHRLQSDTKHHDHLVNLAYQPKPSKICLFIPSL